MAAAEKEVHRLWNMRRGHLYRKSMELVILMKNAACVKDTHIKVVLKSSKMSHAEVNSFRHLFTSGRGKSGRSEVHAHSHK